MADDGITRRDFLNGALIGVGGAAGLTLAPGVDLMRLAAAAEAETANYPPLLQGMRGSHPGSFEHAHELAHDGREDWGPVVETGEDYDLIVVGGGLFLPARIRRRGLRPGARQPR